MPPIPALLRPPPPLAPVVSVLQVSLESSSPVKEINRRNEILTSNSHPSNTSSMECSPKDQDKFKLGSYNFHTYVKEESPFDQKQSVQESSPQAYQIDQPLKMLQHKQSEHPQYQQHLLRLSHNILPYQSKQNDAFLQRSPNFFLSENRGKNSASSNNHAAPISPSRSASDIRELYKPVSPDTLMQMHSSAFYQKEAQQSQKFAMHTFTSRFPGYMSPLQLHGASSDTPLTRLRFPLSPSGNTSRLSSAINSPFPQTISPLINMSKPSQMQHSPVQRSPVQRFFNYNLSDPQKRHEVDLIHCQRDCEFDLETRSNTELILQREVEPECEVGNKMKEDYEVQKKNDYYRMKEFECRMREEEDLAHRCLNRRLYDRSRSGDVRKINQPHYHAEKGIDYNHQDSMIDSDDFHRHISYQARSKAEQLERAACIPTLQKPTSKTRESFSLKPDRRKLSDPTVESSLRYKVFLNEGQSFEKQQQTMIAPRSVPKLQSEPKSIHKSNSSPSLGRNQTPPVLQRLGTPPVMGYIGPGISRENEVTNLKQNVTKIVRPWEMNPDVSQRTEMAISTIKQNLSPRNPNVPVDLKISDSLIPTLDEVVPDNSFLKNMKISQPFDLQKEKLPTSKSFKTSSTAGFDSTLPHNQSANKAQKQNLNEINCPVIQLAPTSIKFKEQIISFAQYNSPTPQAFPKFTFNDNFEMHESSVGNKQLPTQGAYFSMLPVPISGQDFAVNRSKAVQLSYAESPIMPFENEPSFDSSRNNPISRLRSDSEETVSSDELDPGDKHLSQENPEPSLLIQRLKRRNEHDFPSSKSNDDSEAKESYRRMPEQFVSRRDLQEKHYYQVYSHDIIKNKNISTELALNNIVSSKVSSKTKSLLKGKYSVSGFKSPESFKSQNETEKKALLVDNTRSVDKTETLTSVFRHEKPFKLAKSVSLENVEKPKMKRCDSPDIYDDLKVHNYEEQRAESPLDLYSDAHPQPNTRERTPLVKSSPKNDDLFYILSQDDVKGNSRQIISKETSHIPQLDEDREVAVISSTGGDLKKVHRSDGSTPVMDEPVGDISEPLSMNNESGNASFSYTIPSPSTPEAHTPLLDEPAYCFEQPEKLSGHYSGNDFEKFITSPAATSSHCLQTEAGEVSASPLHYLRSGNYTHPVHESAQKDGVFESISPPCSPGRISSQNISFTPSNNSIVAFPFSALAFNVSSSRPGSRSSIHSPLPSEGTSPRIDDSKCKRRRESHDTDNKEFDQTAHQLFDGKKLMQKPYQRSMSQSSSNNSSKSPEYEYKSKSKPSVNKFSHSIEQRSFHERRYEQARSYKRGSRSPDNDRLLNKRLRK